MLWGEWLRDSGNIPQDSVRHLLGNLAGPRGSQLWSIVVVEAPTPLNGPRCKHTSSAERFINSHVPVRVLPSR